MCHRGELRCRLWRHHHAGEALRCLVHYLSTLISEALRLKSFAAVASGPNILAGIFKCSSASS